MTTSQQLHNSGLTIENAPLFYRAVWAYTDLAEAMSSNVKTGRNELVRASASAVEDYAYHAQVSVESAIMGVMAVGNPSNYL